MAVHIKSGFASFCTFANRQLTIGILISIVNDSLAIDNQELIRPGQVYREKLKVANHFLLKSKTAAAALSCQHSRTCLTKYTFSGNSLSWPERISSLSPGESQQMYFLSQ